MTIRKVCIVFLLTTFFLFTGCIPDDIIYKSIETETMQNGSSENLEVLAIDKIVNDIELSIKDKVLEESNKQFDYSEPYVPTSKTIYFDSDNIVRKYTQEAGSDDSKLSYNFFYDENELLRFIKISGSAINGSELEHKIYFDTKGDRVLESHQYLKGPGYTFPEVWPIEELIFDPVNEYNK